MNECPLTDDELRQVGGADHETLAPFFALHADEVDWPEGAPEGIDPRAILNPEEVEEDIAFLRLVCHRVVEARSKKNIHAEQSALAPGQRWGRKGAGTTPLTYIAGNVNRVRGRPAERAMTRKQRRATRYQPGKGFVKPFDPYKITRKRFRTFP